MEALLVAPVARPGFIPQLAAALAAADAAAARLPAALAQLTLEQPFPSRKGRFAVRL